MVRRLQNQSRWGSLRRKNVPYTILVRTARHDVNLEITRDIIPSIQESMSVLKGNGKQPLRPLPVFTKPYLYPAVKPFEDNVFISSTKVQQVPSSTDIMVWTFGRGSVVRRGRYCNKYCQAQSYLDSYYMALSASAYNLCSCCHYIDNVNSLSTNPAKCPSSGSW